MITARGKGADHAGDADLAEIRIDFHFREDRAMRVHGVVRLRRRIRRAGAAGFDLLEAGAGEDLAIRFAAAFIVAAVQAAVARDHAGIARAEQRRALVAGREVGEFCDHGRTGVVDRHAGGRGMRRAARDPGVGQIGACRI